MSTQELWKEYIDIKYSDNVNKKISVLSKCAEQSVDDQLSRSAKRDLGLIYYQGDASVKDIDKAKKYLHEAAEAGDENAKQFYGIILYNEGNFASFYYFREAMELGNIHSAYMMYDNLHIKEDNPIAKRMIHTVEEQIEFLIDSCQYKIENGDDEDGTPQFALALVGLYDLGKKFGIDRAKGQEYLQLALKKGNGNAQFMQQNPVLMKPETMNQYKPPTVKEMQKMERAMVKEQEKELASVKLPKPPKVPKQKKSRGGIKGKLIFLLIIVLIVAVISLREVIFTAATAVIGAILPIVSIIFLIWVASIVYGDESGFSAGSSSSSNESDPWTEYKDNTNCNNMPSCIYDSNNNRWDRVSTYENGATYRNYDLGEISITSCDIKSKSAYGTGGHYHWY